MSWDDATGDEATEGEPEAEEERSDEATGEDSDLADLDKIERTTPDLPSKADTDELVEKLRGMKSSGGSGSSGGQVVRIEFGRQDLEDQTERLQTQLGVSGDEAELMIEATQNAVRRKAKEDEKKWREEAIDAVANSMISMYLQEKSQIRGESEDD